MAALQKVAKGFTGLLGLREAGATPKEWAEFLQPTMDLLQFYAAERGRRNFAATSALAAIGSSITVEVPGGDMWLVEKLGCNLEFGAIGQQFVVGFRHDGFSNIGGGSATVELATHTTHVSSGATASSWFGYPLRFPVIVLGGEKFRFQVLDNLGTGFAGVTATFNVVGTVVSSGPGQLSATR